MIRSTGRRVANVAQGVMGNLSNRAPAKASAAASRGRNMAARVGGRVQRNPLPYAAGGVAGVGGLNYMTKGRRGRGMDKSGPGRPTGMYRY